MSRLRNEIRALVILLVVVSIPVMILALWQRMIDDVNEKIFRCDDMYGEADGWDYFV